MRCGNDQLGIFYSAEILKNLVAFWAWKLFGCTEIGQVTSEFVTVCIYIKMLAISVPNKETCRKCLPFLSHCVDHNMLR